MVCYHLIREQVDQRGGGISMDASTVTIVIAIVVSNLTTISVLLNQMNRLEDRLGSRIDGVETRMGGVETKVDRLGVELNKTNRRVGRIEERVGRIEGFLMKPGRFTLHDLPDDDGDDAVDGASDAGELDSPTS